MFDGTYPAGRDSNPNLRPVGAGLTRDNHLVRNGIVSAEARQHYSRRFRFPVGHWATPRGTARPSSLAGALGFGPPWPRRNGCAVSAAQRAGQPPPCHSPPLRILRLVRLSIRLFVLSVCTLQYGCMVNSALSCSNSVSSNFYSSAIASGQVRISGTFCIGPDYKSSLRDSGLYFLRLNRLSVHTVLTCNLNVPALEAPGRPEQRLN